METTQFDTEPRRERRRWLFGNQKGGTGKTSFVLLMAEAAALRGLRVLVCDFDPQANATDALLGEDDVDDGTIAMMSDKADDIPVIRPSLWENVDVLGSGLDLAKAEMDSALEGPYRAERALRELAAGYDLVLFDMPPSLGRLLTAGLIAADGVVVVTDATKSGLKAIKNVMESFETVRELNMNQREVELLGIVVNRYKSTGEQDFREGEVREAYGSLVIEGHLPERAGLAEAHASNITVHSHTRGSGSRLQAAYGDMVLQTLLERAGLATAPNTPVAPTTTVEETAR
ncbi:ParA family protein [Nocardioides sp. NPDC058538]|uniref:ParA family protein n=1 Tax=Nocardioides sp. NPDC058538 TaxID=3346542 RepID=UPI00365D8EB3